MKYKYLSIRIGITVMLFAAVLFTIYGLSTNRRYSPRKVNCVSKSAAGASEYLMRIKANQNTHTIDVNDIKTSQNQLKSIHVKKSASANITFRGPDNIGGRTRALLIDKDNSSIMYAGGVSGGLWKSTSAGQYWEVVNYFGKDAAEVANLNVSCITQASNGDIYFGTGEGFANASGTGYSGFMGNGIWKSTDGGGTFSKLESTDASGDNEVFALVNEVAADPTQSQVVYAATVRGLYFTINGGSTWERAELESGSNTLAVDVAVNSNGLVIAAILNKCYIKKPGASVFELRSGKDDLNGGQFISDMNVSRLEFAIAPTDPNYIYCCAASQSQSLRNVYQSKDGGDTWVTVGKGGSAFFNPLGSQGYYDMTIAVNGGNKNVIYVGGLDLWEGKAVATGNLFDWTQLSYWYYQFFMGDYIHADQHAIVFDPKNPNVFFISSDGGISRGDINKDKIPYQFKVMNKNFGVTQFYSVSANSLGHVMGGSQDNGTLIITGKGNTDKNGFELVGGDGGHVAISDIVPSAAFGTLYFGGLYRNVDAEYGDWNSFYVNDIINLHWAAQGGYMGSSGYTNEASFITPIAYWETDDDTYGSDIINFVARRDYKVGEDVIFSSENIFGAPIPYSIKKNPDYDQDTVGFLKGDTIRFRDPYGSLLALGMARTVWFTRSATTFVSPGNDDWFRGIPSGVFSGSGLPANSEGMEKATQLVFSADGDHLFIATDNGNLFRLSNLKYARDKSTACTNKNAEDVVTKLTKIAKFGSRAITGLATDPNSPDNLIVTLGNYGNSKYVYLCTKASTASQSSGTSNFIDITYNLPTAPAYSALIELEEGAGRVLVGNELGAFITNNVFTQASTTLSWEPFGDKLLGVPVYQMKQTTSSQKWANGNQGVIYFGTHGRGFFESRDYNVVGITDNKPNTNANKLNIQTTVYPNPTTDMVNVTYTLPESDEVKIDIYTLSGQLVKQLQGDYQLAGVENTIQIQLNALKQGTYILSIHSRNAQASKRIIKN